MSEQMTMLEPPSEEEPAVLWKDRTAEIKSIRRRRIEWTPELAWMMLRHDIERIEEVAA